MYENIYIYTNIKMITIWCDDKHIIIKQLNSNNNREIYIFKKYLVKSAANLSTNWPDVGRSFGSRRQHSVIISSNSLFYSLTNRSVRDQKVREWLDFRKVGERSFAWERRSYLRTFWHIQLRSRPLHDQPLQAFIIPDLCCGEQKEVSHMRYQQQEIGS